MAVTLQIRASFVTYIDFSLLGAAYSLQVYRWSRRGFSGFARLFHEFAPRDEAAFGSVELDADADGAATFKCAKLLEGLQKTINSPRT